MQRVPQVLIALFLGSLPRGGPSLLAQPRTAGFPTPFRIPAASTIVMFAGFTRHPQVAMAAKIADHEPTQQIFGTVSERVLEILEFLLDAAK